MIGHLYGGDLTTRGGLGIAPVTTIREVQQVTRWLVTEREDALDSARSLEVDIRAVSSNLTSNVGDIMGQCVIQLYLFSSQVTLTAPIGEMTFFLRH